MGATQDLREEFIAHGWKRAHRRSGLESFLRIDDRVEAPIDPIRLDAEGQNSIQKGPFLNVLTNLRPILNPFG